MDDLGSIDEYARGMDHGRREADEEAHRAMDRLKQEHEERRFEVEKLEREVSWLRARLAEAWWEAHDLRRDRVSTVRAATSQ